MNSLLVVGLLAAVALASAGEFPAAGYNHNSYAFHGYYPGKKFQYGTFQLIRQSVLKFLSTIITFFKPPFISTVIMHFGP